MSTPAATAADLTPPDITAADSAKPTAALPIWGDIPALAAVGIGAAIIVAIALPMLRWWWWEWNKPEGYYGHALFVPFLFGLMLWQRRDRLRAVGIAPCLPALFFLFLPALGLHILAEKIEMEAIESGSFLLAITGAAWALFGTRWMRVAAFPFLFLWTMAPLPGPVLNDMTLGMQSLSTTAAAKMLGLMGLSPVHQGNYIILEDYRLNVDVPCSGFKLLLRLLTFSAAFADLSETTRIRQWAIFLFSLPLSLFINALRIALIGLVGECLGASAAHTFHDWSGIITTILCMAILLGFARSLGCRRFAGQPIF